MLNFHTKLQPNSTTRIQAVMKWIDFFKGQLLHLFQFSPEAHSKWNRSFIMGASCWFYSFPGILVLLLLLEARFCSLHEATLYILTALNSFMSDWVYIGVSSYSHALDRWFATASLLATVSKFFILSLTIVEWMIAIALLASSLYTLSQSRKSKVEKTFLFWHCAWHVIGPIGMCWLVLIEYRELIKG